MYLCEQCLILSLYSLVVVPIVLVGNMIDIAIDRDGTLNPTIKRVDGVAMARKIGAYTYCECSAKLNEGVKEVFDEAFQAIAKNEKRKKRYGFICCDVQNY